MELAEAVGWACGGVVVVKEGETRKREAGTETETREDGNAREGVWSEEGMEDEGELWPNTKIAETMVSLWAVSDNCVGWAGWMDELGVDRHSGDRSPKKNVICWGRHTPTYRGTPLSVLEDEGERASGFGCSGTSVSQWTCKEGPSAPTGQDPPPTPWSAKYRYFAGQWRVTIRGLHIFGGQRQGDWKSRATSALEQWRARLSGGGTSGITHRPRVRVRVRPSPARFIRLRLTSLRRPLNGV